MFEPRMSTTTQSDFVKSCVQGEWLAGEGGQDAITLGSSEEQAAGWVARLLCSIHSLLMSFSQAHHASFSLTPKMMHFTEYIKAFRICPKKASHIRLALFSWVAAFPSPKQYHIILDPNRNAFEKSTAFRVPTAALCEPMIPNLPWRADVATSLLP